MTTAIQKTEPKTIATVRVQAMRTALDEEKAIRELLKEYVGSSMVESVDYGKIPGTDKPTLLKPGAEKLVDLFRCTPKFVLVNQSEDFDRGHGFFAYTFRVRLVQRDGGAVLAEGFGSANSREGRYRWRDGQRKCPKCAKATIIKGKEEYGGGWLCFAKRGGCGAKFADTDPTITTQVQGKVENDDVATLANTILKMAKKRALVDGAIALARCSDLFTQDVEDLADNHNPPTEPTGPGPVMTEPPASAPSEPPKPQGSGRVAAAREKAAKAVRAREPQQQELAPESEPEEVVTPLQAMWRLGKEHGKDPKAITQFALGSIGKAAGFTHEDVERVRAALGPVAK